MKKIMLTFGIICTCLCVMQPIIAQSGRTILVEEDGISCSNGGQNTFEYAGSDGGSPARNIYSVAAWSGNSDLAEIKWVPDNGGRWELINYNGTEAFTFWYSTASTAPNPPNLATGAWAADNGCDALLRLEGTGTQSASLPVELEYFYAKSEASGVELEWQTASELNNKGFYIERFSGGHNRWDEMGFVAGHGNSNKRQHYLFIDENPAPGINYYRLRQVDIDGYLDYSPIASVDAKGSKSALNFFPNPAQHGKATLFIQELLESDTHLEVYDGIGHKVLQQNLQQEGGGTDLYLTIDLSDFPAGIYTVRVATSGTYISDRLVVN